jgi:hypothetical protein
MKLTSQPWRMHSFDKKPNTLSSMISKIGLKSQVIANNDLIQHDIPSAEPQRVSVTEQVKL